MMRLMDLGPRWFHLEKGGPVALTFLCPHCQNIRIGVLFREGCHDVVTHPTVFATHTTSDQDVWELLEQPSVATLTLMPSLKVEGHWTGAIVDGRIE